MEIAGYVAALLIGLSLGLMGSGGSILTVPILVYLMHLSPVISMAYSLFVVGTTSMVGSFKYYQQDLVSIRTAFLFGIPSLITVFLTRRFVVPAIPDSIYSFGNFELTKELLLMTLFAAFMVSAAVSMIRKKKFAEGDLKEQKSPVLISLLLQGVAVGLISGMVGAGGGFLIIPALVLFSKLPMKMAVGTSLLIITINSLCGFAGDLFVHKIDWPFLLAFTVLSIIGIFIGAALSNKINGEKLKTGFGWFVLVMGVYIILKEIFLRSPSG